MILLDLWLYCCGALQVWSLLKVNTCFMTGQVFQEQSKLGSRKHLVVLSRVCQMRERTVVLVKTIAIIVSLQFMIDTHCEIKRKFNNWSLSLHRAFCRIIQSAHQPMHIRKIFFIKTFKIAPTCFDPKIIFRELHCSLVKSHFKNINQ